MTTPTNVLQQRVRFFGPQRTWWPCLVFAAVLLMAPRAGLPWFGRAAFPRYHLEPRSCVMALQESPRQFKAATARYQLEHVGIWVVPQSATASTTVMP